MSRQGLIAREQLRPGVPCPVCGSLEHPNPCEIRRNTRISAGKHWMQQNGKWDV